MTGPEHHREAERLIELARQAGTTRQTAPTRYNVGGAPDLPDLPDFREFYTDESSDPRCRSLLADAQVHALLALAAALESPQASRTPRPAIPPHQT